MLSSRSLPALSPDEAAHGARVAQHLRALIAASGGWLSFSQFMEAALYAPGLGYYMAGQARFGAGGDFITAPELSPLFARCLATQLAELLERAGGGDIVEFGAGSGVLAADLLRALAGRRALPRRYRIVEVSAALREEQRARLQPMSSLGTSIDWLDGPPSSDWDGIALANELLDALPVDRFRVSETGSDSLGVAASATGFDWQPRPADGALAAAVAKLAAALPAPLPPGYVSEWRPMLPGWIAAATATLRRGALLVIDYGLPRAQYYHVSRDGGTLCGFFRHRRVDDVLVRAGLQDLTAWVDFSAVADAARACGLQVAGFATQAHFLAALGIDRELAAAAAAADTRQRLALNQGASTLLLPGEMGERFKVMALTRGVDGPFTGFAFRDLSASL
jgi:SAM-dependent MidA family methyltransferase